MSDGDTIALEPPPAKAHRTESSLDATTADGVTRGAFIAGLPKVELHAHLNGSIPGEALRQMLLDSGESADAAGAVVLRAEELLAVRDVAARMKDCFKVFDSVYRVMNRASRLTTAVFTVLDAYASEQTAYVELRTTPRAGLIMDVESSAANPPAGTEADYVDRVMAAMEAYDALQQERLKAPGAANGFMVVKLLLAVGRRMTADQAMRVVELAIRLRDAAIAAGREPRVVGIDFSGDCYSGQWATFEPALVAAKAAGLKVSLHVGEKEDEGELEAMLRLGPDRIGHLVFANPSNTAEVKRQRVPLELCISSNLLTSNWTLADHHVRQWVEFASSDTESTDIAAPPALVHPVSINTDDRGVFDTSMTKELLLFLESMVPSAASTPSASTACLSTLDHAWVQAASAQLLTRREALLLVAITRQAIDDAFADPATKAEMHRLLRRHCESFSASLRLTA